MSKLTITEEELLKSYIKRTDQIAEDCDWVTGFSGKDVCQIVMWLLEQKKVTTTLTSDALYKLYDAKVKALNVSRETWSKEYANFELGVPKIINMIYEILEDNVAI